MASLEASQTGVDTTKLEEALFHLEKLQDQLDNLRSAIPNLVRPIATSQHKCNAEVVREVRNTATATMDDMKKFRAAWSSEQTQAILLQARESGSANPDLNKASSLPEWGWQR